MSQLADIYIIKKTRSKELGLAFSDRFLPKREESAAAYEYPMYGSKVEFEFENSEMVMDFMENNPSASYSLYWRLALDRNLNKHAMFYIPDGYMIFGLSREICMGDHSNEDSCFEEMREFLQSDDGYIAYELLPEANYADFMAIVKQLNASR